VLPLYSDGMVAMLTQSNDELVVKNGLPKRRERMVRTIMLPENTENWSEFLCCYGTVR